MENQRVFADLREANADVLNIMAKQHPAAFAIPRDTTPNALVKIEVPERTSSAVKQVSTRPMMRSQEVIRVSDGDNGSSAAHVVETHIRIKSEDPGDRAQADRINIRPTTNQRGEVMLDMTPEAKYLYWGDWRIVAHGLKMEARQLDGTRIKVWMSLKNVRKPL